MTETLVTHGHWPRTGSQAKLDALIAHISAGAGGMVSSSEIVNGEVVLNVLPENLLKLLRYLHDDTGCAFTQLSDICGVDFPSRPKRFEVVYNLLSIRQNLRLRIKVDTDEDTPVPSVCDIYPAAGWFEREVWDMYGVMFSDNLDLRRILTDYGFDGHPQRRDFPLTGYVEMRYDEEKKRVIYEPVKLNQAYRNFDYLSPWDGTDYPLPGDEKAS